MERNKLIPTKIPMDVMQEGLDLLKGDHIVRVGLKRHGAYMFACTMSLNQRNNVVLVSRGWYNTKTLDILEQLKEQEHIRGNMLDVKISSRTEVNMAKGKNKRVTVLEITIRRLAK